MVGKYSDSWPLLTVWYASWRKARENWMGMRFAFIPRKCELCDSIIWLQRNKIKWVYPGNRHHYCLRCKPMRGDVDATIAYEINRVFFWFRVVAAGMIVLYIILTILGFDPYYQ